MPNHVTNRISFAVQHAERILPAIVSESDPTHVIDFERLVPSPPNLFRGDLSSEEEKDFPINWLGWYRENWGTKWNAYGTKVIREGEVVHVQFDTAWSVPYGVIAGFMNAFRVPFTLRYFDECPNFWGVEEYGFSQWNKDSLGRLSKRRSHDDDKAPLALLLCGRDLAKEERDNAAEEAAESAAK